MLVEPYFDLKTPQSIASSIGGRVVVLPPSVGGETELVTTSNCSTMNWVVSQSVKAHTIDFGGAEWKFFIFC